MLIFREKYCRYRYAHVFFEFEKDMLAALKLNLEFKKGNIPPQRLFWSKEDEHICNICGNPKYFAKDCDNKNINKTSLKKTISGADNWKNLKKSYADVAKSSNNIRNGRNSNNSPPHLRGLNKSHNDHNLK